MSARLRKIPLCLLIILILSSSIVFASKNIEAKKNSSRVLVNGVPTSFEAYTIEGNNYFKLRDIAYILSYTEKQFDVYWDNDLKAINLVTGNQYNIVGGEMEINNTVNINKPTLSTSKIYLNNKEVNLKAYTINNNNYFKLRDLGQAINFSVSWDVKTSTIAIRTDDIYIEEIKVIQTPAVPTFKDVNYKWQYPIGLVDWEYKLKIPIEAVNYYKSIDRNDIFGYSYYVTHEADDEYLAALANVFRNTAKAEKMSEWDTINLAVSFVQNLKYVPDLIGTGYDEYPKFPLETLYDEGGDCEDSSILLVSILRELGYGTVLVIVEDHMGVGIKASEPANFKYMGMDFYYIETTSPGWEIGELPQGLEGKEILILPAN